MRTPPTTRATKRSAVVGSVLACLASSACGTDSSTEPDAGVGLTYAQHIQPILAARCTACHSDGGIGSFPLLDYEDAERWANFAASAIEHEVMPPFPPTADDCAPVADPRAMTREERDMFLQWVADGKAPGDPAAPPEYEVTVPSSSLGEPSHRFALGAEYYAPVEVTEEHRCFLVDPQLATATRFRGIHADTASPERFHQARVHVLPPDRVAEAAALDGIDGRPGWPCYFNPGIVGLQPVGRMLPGLPFESFPNDTALVLEPGTRFVVDAYVHHYSYEPLDLSVIGWAAPATTSSSPTLVELSDDSFVIPAGAESVVATVEAEVLSADADLDGRAEDALPAVHEGPVWSVDVHMHHWGRSARVEVVHADGSRSCLLDIPAWDEEWQGSYSLSAPVQTAAGDRIVATCEWSNRPEDQPYVRGVQIQPGELRWGLDEMSEMCDVRLVLTAR